MSVWDIFGALKTGMVNLEQFRMENCPSLERHFLGSCCCWHQSGWRSVELDGDTWQSDSFEDDFKHFFFIIHGIILPIDFHIFQRGRSTTNQNCLGNVALCIVHTCEELPFLGRWTSIKIVCLAMLMFTRVHWLLVLINPHVSIVLFYFTSITSTIMVHVKFQQGVTE